MQDDPDDAKEYLVIAQKANTITALAQVAQDSAWDYESFIAILIKGLGENPDNKVFNPNGWDT